MPLEDESETDNGTSVERKLSEPNSSTSSAFPSSSTESNPGLRSPKVTAKDVKETHCEHSRNSSTSVVYYSNKKEDNSPAELDQTMKDNECVEIEMGPAKCGTCESCGQELNLITRLNDTEADKSESSSCLLASIADADLCRICHCEADGSKDSLIAPCKCKGSLAYVHHECLQRWIKSSGHKHCELCGFQFAMDTKLKPLIKWEKLSMSKTERRKVCCSVTFHLIAIICVVWSIYVLIERTINELNIGTLDWPFWTKLVVVAVGMVGSLVFMYVQCKTYADLWRRLKANNRIIYVQNQPAGANDNRCATAAEDKSNFAPDSNNKEIAMAPLVASDNRSDHRVRVL